MPWPPTGRLVAVGGGMSRKLRVKLRNRRVEPRLVTFIARVTKNDLLALSGLVEAGKVTPVVGRTYRLDAAAEAIRYVETGHARAKVIITV